MNYPWHKKQWGKLTRLHKAKKLPHALLLQGNQGIGKHDFAKQLAKYILCENITSSENSCGSCHSCLLFASKTHPDLIILKPVAPENSQSKTPVLNIKIDSIRDLCTQLTRTSSYGGYRIAIIENADYMVKSAANSLLKTLEEPGENVLIILVTSQPAKLPITIRSRCSNVNFSIPESSDAEIWLQSEDVINSELALRISHGAPLAAKNCDEEQLSQRQLLLKALIESQNKGNTLTYAAQLTEIPKERAINWMFDVVNDLIKIKSTDTTGNLINSDYVAQLKTISQAIDNKKIFNFYDSLFEAKRTMSFALKPQLFWENLLISWNNLHRREI